MRADLFNPTHAWLIRLWLTWNCTQPHKIEYPDPLSPYHGDGLYEVGPLTLA